MQTKEQKRSRFALEMIDTEFPGGAVDTESANFIAGVPTMVLTNGIGQTMAFLLSNRKKEKQFRVFQIIRAWLEKEVLGLKADADLLFLQKFSTLEQREYLFAQQEALAMLQWLKRYARAFEEEKKK